jgi:hypothetical protein
MGLFDSYYDPQSSPTSSGLLARLLALSGQNQQMAFAGLPSDQAQYAPDARRCD